MSGIYALKEAREPLPEPSSAQSMELSKPVDRASDDNVDDAAALGEPEDVESADYEIVMGRRQLASVSFVVLVLMAIFSTVSYLAGKALAPKAPPATQQVVVASPAPPPPLAIPQIEATIAAPVAEPARPAPIAALIQADLNDPPIFSNPVPGAVYIQMAAVEKAIAAIFAAGLRGNGFQSFVAPGPNDKIFRVLIGPLPDPTSYARAKEKLDQLGLNTFGKRVENQPPPASK